ncbi:MAG: alpha/beta hydrolase [Gammaproteobacteria bacterium]|nr:alpha/beta hydrolase [Gammaproteobacteria bacterium]
MPLDARARRFLETLAALNPPDPATLSVAARREGLAHLLSFGGPAEEIGASADLELPTDPPLPLRSYTPRGADPRAVLPGIVYFHGGGLVAGSLDTHDGICRALANASGCRLLAVGYRLGPEAPFPAAVDDALAATMWCATHTEELALDGGGVGVAGDSAGGTLAAIVCQELARSGAATPRFQFLLCPIMDFAAESESRRALASGYLIERGTLEHDLQHYLPAGTDPAQPRVSPLRAINLRGLPPAIIHAAEFDPLRDEGEAYAARLRAVGVPARFRCHPGMIHLFYGMRGLIPYAAQAFALMGADIRTIVLPSQALDT